MTNKDKTILASSFVALFFCTMAEFYYLLAGGSFVLSALVVIAVFLVQFKVWIESYDGDGGQDKARSK